MPLGQITRRTVTWTRTLNSIFCSICVLAIAQALTWRRRGLLIEISAVGVVERKQPASTPSSTPNSGGAVKKIFTSPPGDSEGDYFCLRFLKLDPFTSSGLAENEEVPGIASFAPFAFWPLPSTPSSTPNSGGAVKKIFTSPPGDSEGDYFTNMV
jgi:hypothetical protein